MIRWEHSQDTGQGGQTKSRTQILAEQLKVAWQEEYEGTWIRSTSESNQKSRLEYKIAQIKCQSAEKALQADSPLNRLPGLTSVGTRCLATQHHWLPWQSDDGHGEPDKVTNR